MKRLSTSVAGVLVATLLSCQSMSEFGDGKTLEPVATFGKPGPTPTNDRPGGVLMHLWFRPDQRGLVGCRSDGTIVLTDMQGRSTEIAQRTTEVCDYAADADALLLRESDDEIIILDLATQLRQTVAEGAYGFGAISEDGGTVALARDRTVDVWDTSTKQLKRQLAARTEVRNGLDLSANGAVVATAQGSYDDGHHTLVQSWNVDSGALLGDYEQREPGTNAGVWGLRLSRNGLRLAAGSQAAARSGLRVWKGAAEILFQRGGFRSYWVRALALSPDGDLLVSGDEEGNVVLWDLDANRELANARAGQVVQSVALSIDGKLVAAGLWDSRIAVWRLSLKK